jgi:hypothetical protein
MNSLIQPTGIDIPIQYETKRFGCCRTSHISQMRAPSAIDKETKRSKNLQQDVKLLYENKHCMDDTILNMAVIVTIFPRRQPLLSSWKEAIEVLDLRDFCVGVIVLTDKQFVVPSILD